MKSNKEKATHKFGQGLNKKDIILIFIEFGLTILMILSLFAPAIKAVWEDTSTSQTITFTNSETETYDTILEYSGWRVAGFPYWVKNYNRFLTTFGFQPMHLACIIFMFCILFFSYFRLFKQNSEKRITLYKVLTSVFYFIIALFSILKKYLIIPKNGDAKFKRAALMTFENQWGTYLIFALAIIAFGISLADFNWRSLREYFTEKNNSSK